MATQDYVLNGTTTFTFPFAVRSASVLTLELVPGGVVSTGDYTVTGAGPTSTGVTVTYPNAPTSATTVLRITRYVQPDRATTLNGPSDITVANLNAEFDNAYDAIADFQVAGVNIGQAVIDAEAAAQAAEAAAAGVDLPSLTGADVGKMLVASVSGKWALVESSLSTTTPGSIARRDSGGRVKVATPTDSFDAANKAYVDGRTRRADGQSFTAGTGGDFDTLSEALDFITRLLPPGSLSYAPVVLTVLPSALTAATTNLNGAHMPWLNIHIPDTGGATTPVITCRNGTVLGAVSSDAGSRGLLDLRSSHVRQVTSASATVERVIALEGNSSAAQVVHSNPSHEAPIFIHILNSRVGVLSFSDSVNNSSTLPAVQIVGNSSVRLTGTLTTLAGSEPVVYVSQGTAHLGNTQLLHSGTGVDVEIQAGGIVSSDLTVTSNVTKNTISANGLLMCP